MPFSQLSRKIYALMLAVLLLWASPCLAENPGTDAQVYKSCFATGKKMFNAKRYADAAAQFEMALKGCDESKDSPQLLELYTLLGQSYYHTGKLSQGETYLKKVLEDREASGKNMQQTFVALMFLGTVYRNQHKFSDSEALYRRGLSLYQGKGPIKSLYQSLVFAALGTLYLEMDKPKEAEASLREALSVRDTSMFKGVVKEYILADAMARAFTAQGKYEEAQRFLIKAIADARKDKNYVQENMSKGNLAMTYLVTDRYEQAKKLLEEALVELQRSVGTESNDIATIHSYLGQVANGMDRYVEAEAEILKAMTIHERNLGNAHTSVAFDLGRLAEVYRNQGKYELAIAKLHRALEIMQNEVGQNSINYVQALINLAGIWNEQAKYDDAERVLRQAADIVQQVQGPESPAVGDIFVKMATGANAKKNYKFARELLQGAVKILERNKNSEPSRLMTAYSDLAALDIKENLLSEAEQNLKKSLSLREQTMGITSPRLLVDLRALSQMYTSQNRTSEAKEVQEKIRAIEAVHPEMKRPEATISPNPPLVFEEQPIARIPTLSPAIPEIVRATPHHPSGVQDKWALVIGVSNFEDPSINLKYASKDAVDFNNYLINEGNFASDHVKLLTDKDATRENIVKFLGDKWLGRVANRDDLVLIYVSSHASPGQSGADGINFLVAHDTDPGALVSTGIPMQWLSQMIKEQVHSNRIVLILDVCHAGAVNSGKKDLARFNPNTIPMGDGQVIVCSCSPDQSSWESRNYPNSVFTYRLLESLKLNDQADLVKAFNALRERVESEVLRDRGKLQTPLLYAKAWKGPPPVLNVRPDSPRAGMSN